MAYEYDFPLETTTQFSADHDMLTELNLSLVRIISTRQCSLSLSQADSMLAKSFAGAVSNYIEPHDPALPYSRARKERVDAFRSGQIIGFSFGDMLFPEVEQVSETIESAYRTILGGENKSYRSMPLREQERISSKLMDLGGRGLSVVGSMQHLIDHAVEMCAEDDTLHLYARVGIGLGILIFQQANVRLVNAEAIREIGFTADHMEDMSEDEWELAMSELTDGNAEETG